MHYNKVIKLFYKLLSFFCNFFMSLNEFYYIFFFVTGYKKKYNKILNNFKFSLQIFKNVNNKFLNTIFNRFINNYYSDDFFLKNSKVMALCASKQTLVLK